MISMTYIRKARPIDIKSLEFYLSEITEDSIQYYHTYGKYGFLSEKTEIYDNGFENRMRCAAERKYETELNTTYITEEIIFDDLLDFEIKAPYLEQSDLFVRWLTAPDEFVL